MLCDAHRLTPLPQKHIPVSACRDNSKLADALAAAAAAQASMEGSMARAVDSARREERGKAEGRLQQLEAQVG